MLKAFWAAISTYLARPSTPQKLKNMIPHCRWPLNSRAYLNVKLRIFWTMELFNTHGQAWGLMGTRNLYSPFRKITYPNKFQSFS